MSQIELPAEYVRDTCNKVIKYIWELRSEDCDNAVEEELEEINNKWYRKLFRMRPLTKKEVQVILNNGTIWHSYHYAKREYYKTLSQAEDLLKSAELVIAKGNSLISLNEDDVQVLQFIRKE